MNRDNAPLDPAEGLQARVQRLAMEAGFATAGIAPTPRLSERNGAELARYFEAWVAAGHAGEMEYLKRKDAAGQYVRGRVEAAAPWARSIVVCAAPYGGGRETPLSTDPPPAGARGWIGRYAWTGRRTESGELAPSDYHKVLLRRLKLVEAGLHAELGEFESWAYVDTGPVIERALAAMAGVGWTGKNVCTLNQNLGSFFFLGVILTGLEVPTGQHAVIAADRCGSCTRCLDACPTGALIAPRQMDAARCISYLTIEKRGTIDPELRAAMGRQVFGCDICQDVCPWNARARRGPIGFSSSEDAEMTVRPELVNPSLAWLAGLTRVDWERLFFGSPVKRARWSGFRRNVALAIGNSGDREMAPLLEGWAAESEPDEVVRAAAQWALGRLSSQSTGQGSSARDAVSPETGLPAR